MSGIDIAIWLVWAYYKMAIFWHLEPNRALHRQEPISVSVISHCRSRFQVDARQSSSVNSSNVKPKWFLGSLDISKKHQILSIGLIEDFSRNLVNISDCRALVYLRPWPAVWSDVIDVMMLYKSSVNSSYVKPKWFLGSPDISKET